MAVESRDLSQADKKIIRVSSFPKQFLKDKIYSCTKKKLFGTWQFGKTATHHSALGKKTLL